LSESAVIAAASLLDEAEDAVWLYMEAVGPPRSIAALERRHATNMKRLTSRLSDGKITLGEFETRAQKAISGTLRQGYEMGRGRTLDAGDEEWLRRATQTEVGYARKFGQDIEAGTLRMPRKRRAAMYGTAARGAWWNARVERELEKDPNVRIYWRLHPQADHCPDCQVLAAQSPFTGWNLPTTPQAGATVCRGNCKCKLEFVHGRPGARERAEAEQYGQRKKAGVSTMLDPGVAPAGMRLPNAAETVYIDDLRARINYNRRIIATSADADEVAEAIAARKAANAELIEFVERESIWEVPVWSVDDVVDGRHIGRAAEAEIFSAGIDGSTLGMLDRRQAANAIARYEREVGEKFADREVYSVPSVQREAKEPTEQQRSRWRGGAREYQLVASGVRKTLLLMGRLLKAARGREVQVGPLSLGVGVLSKVYPWVRGPEAEVEKVLKGIRGDFVAVPVELRDK